MEDEDTLVKSPSYRQVLTDIREILDRTRYKAYKAVDNIRVQTYWQTGERINREELKHGQRASYGKELVKKLASDLGISERVLYRCVQFYRAYAILPTVSAELSWSHYDELIKIASREERQFYESQAIHNCWSIRKLRKEIRHNLFNNRKHEEFRKTNTAVSTYTPVEIFKNTYNFDFLQLPKEHDEKEVEDGLANKVVNMLLESKRLTKACCGEIGYGVA